jgi:tetratricopeptide (TPR) repeat protein
MNGTMESADSFLKKGLTARAAKDYEAAIELFCACTSDALKARAHIEVITTLRLAGRVNEALSALQNLEDGFRAHHRVALEEVLILKAMGRLDDAIGAARKSASMFPAAMPVRVQLGHLLRMTGSGDEAIEVLRSCIADGDEFHSHLELSKIYRSTGCHDEASRILAGIQPEFHDQHAVIMEKVRLLKCQGKWLDALQQLDKVQDSNEYAMFERIVVLRNLSRHADAWKALNKASELYPENTHLIAERFYLMTDMGKAHEALAVAQSDAEKMKSRPAHLDVLLARALMRASRPGDALQYALNMAQNGTGPEKKVQGFLIAVQAAFASGDIAGAKAYFSQAILEICSPDIQRDVHEVLAAVLYHVEGPRVLLEMEAGLPKLGDISAEADTLLRFLQGDCDGIVEKFEAAAAEGMLRFPEWSMLRQAAEFLGNFPFIHSTARTFLEQNKLNARQVASLQEPKDVAVEAGLNMAVMQNLAEMTGYAEPRSFPLILGLASASQPAEIERIVRHVLDFVEQEFPDKALQYFLAVEGDALAEKIHAQDVASRLARLSGRARTALDETADLRSVLVERRLCDLIYRNPVAPARVSVLAPVHRRQDLVNLRMNIERQDWPALETIVVANGELYTEELVERTLDGLPNVRIIHRNKGNVGSYLNAAADIASGDYLVRFDADDIYLANYVSTAVSVMNNMDAEVAAQHSFFAYIQSIDRVVLFNRGVYFVDWRKAQPYSVVGATTCMRREVFEQIRYAETIERGEDVIFHRNALINGKRCAVLDPFNFVVVRRNEKDKHTYCADDMRYLRNDTVFVGRPEVIPLLATPTQPDSMCSELMDYLSM